MSKKIAVVGGAGQIAAALAHVMTQNPNMVVTFVDKGEKSDFTGVATDGQNIFYDSKMIEALTANMSERELYGIQLHEAHRLLTDRQLGDYKIPVKDVSVKTEYFDDLPKTAKKPKFLLEQNHNIRGFRR